jgi:predicted transcriptional regulator
MKIIALLICAAILCSCETAPKHHTRRRSTKAVEDTSIIYADKNGTVVSAGWLTRYKRLEKKAGEIPEDSQISAEGNSFRIPPAAVSHFEKIIREHSGTN